MQESSKHAKYGEHLHVTLYNFFCLFGFFSLYSDGLKYFLGIYCLVFNVNIVFYVNYTVDHFYQQFLL